jgi:alkylation response protein AidB-like acyl-CoA dehydrogenase
MDFDFSEEQQALRKTARDFLHERGGLARTRAVLDEKLAWDRALWSAAGELGWIGATLPEEVGGAGLGALELAVLAEELGRALAALPSLSIYLAAEGLRRFGAGASHGELLRIARGELVCTVALAESAGRTVPTEVATRFESGRLTGAKVGVADAGIAGRALVLARGADNQLRLVWVGLEQEGVRRSSGGSLDPTRPVGGLEFREARAEELRTEDARAVLDALLDRAAVLLAFEQLGGAERAFALTKEYVETRFAFGRPVASFQAIKHRLVDIYVALELARSNCLFGAWALASGAPELPAAAAAARLAATSAFDLAAREMIQLHGGVGFTWEYDCHLFYRRARFTGLVLGGTSEWRERLLGALERGNPKEVSHELR